MTSILRENKTTMALAFPIITGQLSQMLIGLVDTVMIGRVGTVELAAAAFSNVLFFVPFVFGIGLFASVSVMVAQAHGAQRDDEGREIYRNGYLLALILGLLMALGLIGTFPFLGQLGQPAAVVTAVPSYLLWMALSLIPTLPMFTIKHVAEARNRPWAVLWITLGGVGLNVIFNYVLIFGKFGSPALGLAGAGIATLLARLATWWALWVYQKQSNSIAPVRPDQWLRRPTFATCRQIARIGLPISCQLMLEVGTFGAVALLMGRFGSEALAAHQITVSCAGFTFMVPLGIAMAVTIRVGHSLGCGQPERCTPILIGAHATTFLVMGTSALTFLFGGAWIAGLFSPDPSLIEAAAGLLAIAAAFQIFDGGQVISMGGLRGIKDVNLPTALIFVGFWVIGIPLGAYLAFARDFGPRGLWIGLATGLGFAALVLTLRLAQKLRKKLKAN
jgi:multidrug resistance protein, MATE family